MAVFSFHRTKHRLSDRLTRKKFHFQSYFTVYDLQMLFLDFISYTFMFLDKLNCFVEVGFLFGCLLKMYYLDWCDVREIVIAGAKIICILVTIARSNSGEKEPRRQPTNFELSLSEDDGSLFCTGLMIPSQMYPAPHPLAPSEPLAGDYRLNACAFGPCHRILLANVPQYRLSICT